MLPIKQFLNKIQFSGKFNKNTITLSYYDRIQKKLIPLEYRKIKVEGNFLILDERHIPLHRIKEIRKNGVIIWKRLWQNI